MEFPDNLLCLFTAQLEEREDGSYCIEVPAQEVKDGQVTVNEVYRVALLQTEAAPSEKQAKTSPSKEESQREEQTPTEPEPPIEMGEKRTVEIENIGEQGDGIARVERGYVIIVPDTDVHERVTIEITNISPNVAFGEVVERHDHYE